MLCEIRYIKVIDLGSVVESSLLLLFSSWLFYLLDGSALAGPKNFLRPMTGEATAERRRRALPKITPGARCGHRDSRAPLSTEPPVFSEEEVSLKKN